MENEDNVLLIMRLVDTIAKQAQREKLLEKRRADVRYPVDMVLPVAYKLLSNSSFVGEGRACLLDICYHGVGMLVQRELEPRSIVTLNLIGFDLPHVCIPARIVFSRMMLPGAFRVGAEFLLDEVSQRKYPATRLLKC
jgi:hypothetical protein